MDIDRVIALNRYTRLDIEAYGYTPPENQTVICVGNVIERRKLENAIKTYTPISVVGYGKTTAVLEICDRLGLEYSMSLPIYDREAVYIIRNPRKTKELEQYINSSVRLVILYDKLVKQPTQAIVRLGNLTQTELDEYKALKGMEMMVKTTSKEEVVRQTIAKFLRKGKIYPLPENTHRWILQNFSDNPEILRICMLADKVKSSEKLYYAVLHQIRHRRSINLEYPIWLKKK